MDKEKQANALFSTKNKKTKKEEKEYELLLDNQVDFVKSDLLGGLMDKKIKKEAKKQKKKKNRKSESDSESSDDSSLSEDRIEEM